MSEEKDDKWKMPKPVFRSSTGGLPKSFEDTISFAPNRVDEPDPDDDILGIMDPQQRPDATRPDTNSSEEPVDIHAEPADPQEAADAEAEAMVEAQPRRDTFWSFTTIFLLMVIVAAAILVVVFYFMRTGQGETTFQ